MVYSPTTCGFTEPVVTTVTVPEASVAVAPASVYVASWATSSVKGLVPVTVTAGAVVSTTLTVLVAVPALPDGSVDV